MFISQELRKKSIAEYLLYMWQVEDIIRAYDCSLSRIRREYISRFDYDDEQLEEMTDWYGNLVTMMNQEGKREGGHLQINQVVLQQMTELHSQLLESTKLPFIVELRNRGDKDKNEIETCLDALYGTMMLRLQNKEITPNTAHAIQEITTLLGMLSDYYAKDKQGELILDEG